MDEHYKTAHGGLTMPTGLKEATDITVEEIEKVLEKGAKPPKRRKSRKRKGGSHQQGHGQMARVAANTNTGSTTLLLRDAAATDVETATSPATSSPAADDETVTESSTSVTTSMGAIGDVSVGGTAASSLASNVDTVTEGSVGGTATSGAVRTISDVSVGGTAASSLAADAKTVTEASVVGGTKSSGAINVAVGTSAVGTVAPGVTTDGVGVGTEWIDKHIHVFWVADGQWYGALVIEQKGSVITADYDDDTFNDIIETDSKNAEAQNYKRIKESPLPKTCPRMARNEKVRHAVPARKLQTCIANMLPPCDLSGHEQEEEEDEEDEDKEEDNGTGTDNARHSFAW